MYTNLFLGSKTPPLKRPRQRLQLRTFFRAPTIICSLNSSILESNSPRLYPPHLHEFNDEQKKLEQFLSWRTTYDSTTRFMTSWNDSGILCYVVAIIRQNFSPALLLYSHGKAVQLSMSCSLG